MFSANNALVVLLPTPPLLSAIPLSSSSEKEDEVELQDGTLSSCLLYTHLDNLLNPS